MAPSSLLLPAPAGAGWAQSSVRCCHTPFVRVPALASGAGGRQRTAPVVVHAAPGGTVLERGEVEEMQPTGYELMTDRDWSREFAEYSRATQQLQELANLQVELMNSVATVDSMLTLPALPRNPVAEDPALAEQRRVRRQQSRAARKNRQTPAPAQEQHEQAPSSAVVVQAAVAPVQAPLTPVPTSRTRAATPHAITTPSAPAPISTPLQQQRTRSVTPAAGAVRSTAAPALPSPSALALSTPAPKSPQGLFLSLPPPPKAAKPAESKSNRVRTSRLASRSRSTTPTMEAGASTSATGAKDSTGQFLKVAGSVALLTPEQQRELAILVKDFLRLKAVEKEVAKVLKRKPTLQEFALAMKMDPLTLQAQLQKGQDAKTHVVQANYRLVVSVVKKFQNRGLSLQDLITEGMQGLLRGVEKFEVDKGFRFSTYAHWWIRQAVTRSLQEQSRTVRLPTHIQDILNKIRSARAQLQAELGRYPSAAEVSALTGVSVDRIDEVLAMANQNTSLEAPMADDDGGSEMKDMIVDERSTPDQVFEDEMVKQNMEVVLSQLSHREAEVLRMHWGLDGRKEMTLEEIGAHFKVTRERVRQLESRAVQRLKESQSRLTGVLSELNGIQVEDASAGQARASRGTRKT